MDRSAKSANECSGRLRRPRGAKNRTVLHYAMAVATNGELNRHVLSLCCERKHPREKQQHMLQLRSGCGDKGKRNQDMC